MGDILNIADNMLKQTYINILNSTLDNKNRINGVHMSLNEIKEHANRQGRN